MFPMLVFILTCIILQNKNDIVTYDHTHTEYVPPVVIVAAAAVECKIKLMVL